ncbi:hypothetical protein ACC776_37650, partial [Rhizobium johnstonii]
VGGIERLQRPQHLQLLVANGFRIHLRGHFHRRQAEELQDVALRFANALYEPLWNANYIDHVKITVAESVGLEGRAGYYDTAG